MKVIILCAGYATRLYPLTKDKPKPLLTVAEKPIVEYLLEEIKDVKEIDHVYFVTNDRFSSHFQEWQQSYQYHKPITIVNDKTTSNDDRLGAIGDMLFTIEGMSIDDDLLVIAGDNIFDINMNEFLAFANQNKPYASMAAFDIKDKELAKQYGIVAIDEASQVVNFLEKPDNPPSTLASLALYFFPQSSLPKFKEYIDAGNNPDQPGKYIAWLSKNDKVYCFSFAGTWFDIGDFDSLEKANEFYKN